MASPATRKKTGPKPGVRQHRQPELRQARIEQALDGVGDDGRCHPVTELEWRRQLRVPAWEQWAELPEVVNFPDDSLREQGIMPSPPDSAVHDGIIGRATRERSDLDQPEAGRAERSLNSGSPLATATGWVTNRYSSISPSRARDWANDAPP